MFVPRARISLISLVCAVFGATVLHGADFSTYRGLQFGANLPATAKQAGAIITQVRVVDSRPALIQESSNH